ncbi:MAG: TolB family protein, partial [Deinococcus sp.]
MATVQMPPLPSPHPAAGPASLLSLSFPSDPQLSPGGERVAFVLTRVGEENPQNPDPEFPKPRYKSRVQLWADGKVRDLTLVEGRDSSPRWAPDGRSLAVLSDRRGEPDKPGKNQVFLLPLDGGEARQLTRFETGVSELAFSPDGRYLSFLSRGDAVDRRDERGEPRATESVRYRFNGRGMLPPESAALYLHDLQSGEASVWHAPASDITDYSWRPDSAGVLFVSSLSEEDAAFWRQEVFELPLGGEPRRLTRWAAPLSGLAPHPDGERFAAVGRPPGSLNTEDPHPFLFTPDGEGRRLDPAWDFPAGNSVAGDLHVGAFPERPVWTDPETLALSYTVGGSCGLFGVSLEGVVSPLLHHPERVVSAFSLIGGGLAYLDESVTEPPEVYLNGRR